jgi:hypothetical protein
MQKPLFGSCCPSSCSSLPQLLLGCAFPRLLLRFPFPRLLLLAGFRGCWLVPRLGLGLLAGFPLLLLLARFTLCNLVIADAWLFNSLARATDYGVHALAR